MTTEQQMARALQTETNNFCSSEAKMMLRFAGGRDAVAQVSAK